MNPLPELRRCVALTLALAIPSYAQIAPAPTASPLKVTKTKASGTLVTIEWYDGSKQDIVYYRHLVGLGTGQGLYSISGGLALAMKDRAEFIHTCYPSDYLSDHQPKMDISADGRQVLYADNADSGVGKLAQGDVEIEVDEVRVKVSGRLIDAEADTQVELIFRADAPRLIMSRSRITYTRDVPVKRLYHQLIYANPKLLTGTMMYLYGLSDGKIAQSEAITGDVDTGIFFISSTGKFTGFLAPKLGSKAFIQWQSGDYFAAYKVLYDDIIRTAGEVTESVGVSSWGYSPLEAAQWLTWAKEIEAGRPAVTLGDRPPQDRSIVHLLTTAFR